LYRTQFCEHFFFSVLLAERVSPTGVDKGNLYFDELLSIGATQESLKLQLGSVPVPPFQVDLWQASAGRSDLRVEFTKGTLDGLPGGVRRFGNASAPGYLHGNLTLGSHIRFVDVKITCSGKAMGASAARFNNELTIQTSLMATTALLEVMAFPPGTPNLFTFMLNGPVNITVLTPDHASMSTEERSLYKEQTKK
ncbi:secreted protein, putative, partial [Ixodes scapularis]